MNKYVVNIICFAAGAGVGFLVAKKVLENHYAEIAQEEIDSVKETFANKENKVITKTTVHVEEKVKSNGLTNEEYEEYNKQVKSYVPEASYIRNQSEIKKMNYNLIHKEQDDEEEEDDPTEVDAAGYSENDHHDTSTTRDLTGIDRTKPYIITDEEYTDEFEHHDKLSLYYYTDDDVLCEENEEIIDDVNGVIGSDNLKVIKQKSKNKKENLAWIRNEPLSSDYEICVIRGSYVELISGLEVPEKKSLTPREKYEKRGE